MRRRAAGFEPPAASGVLNLWVMPPPRELSALVLVADSAMAGAAACHDMREPALNVCHASILWAAAFFASASLARTEPMTTPPPISPWRRLPIGGEERCSDFCGGYGLYCAGRLYEAAAAHFKSPGKRTPLDSPSEMPSLFVARLTTKAFKAPDGHLEVALVCLYKATNDREYFDVANFP